MACARRFALTLTPVVDPCRRRWSHRRLVHLFAPAAVASVPASHAKPNAQTVSVQSLRREALYGRPPRTQLT
eukprot:1801685-Prymnesium_polylepis.1